MILDDLLAICDAETKVEKAQMVDTICSNGGENIIKFIFDDMIKFNIAAVRLPELRLFNPNSEPPTTEELENLLQRLINKSISGNTAVNVCNNFGNRLTDEQFGMFYDILQSNPRLGIGATDLNKRCELFKVPQFKVHLCLALKKAKGKISYDKVWTCQPKIDGVRTIGIKDTSIKLYSRKGHARNSMQNIVNILNKYPTNIVFDGEVEHGDSLETTGAIRRLKEQAEGAKLTLFGAYDIDQWKSEKHTDPYLVCYDRAKAFVDSLTDYERSFVNIVESIVIGSFNSETEWLKAVSQHYEHFLSIGYEGAIIKTLDHVYLPSSGSKRSIFTIKDKPWQDMEATVIGFNESDTNPNTLGSFQCITNDGKEFDVALGNIKHGERDYIWNHQDKFIDQQLEFKYQQLSIYGIPRHPTAVKFRFFGD